MPFYFTGTSKKAIVLSGSSSTCSELNGRTLVVEVVMEFPEVVVFLGPNCKHIVNVPHP